MKKSLKQPEMTDKVRDALLRGWGRVAGSMSGSPAGQKKELIRVLKKHKKRSRSQ